MSTPAKTALLIVDTQVGVIANAHEPQQVVGRIEALVQRARAAGVPVLWVLHESDELVPESPSWQLAPPLAPAAGEVVIRKRYNSSFAETPLQATLQAQGIRRVVLAGAMTNWCIRATAFAALERGYDLALASDAHTTEAMDFGHGRVIAADALIDELNAGLRWLSVPGVAVQVRPAAEIAL
jgi:nicotinamidase-related amidase